MGKVKKKHLFSNFLFFSTFAQRTNKKTFFFVKHWTKKCTKNCFFHFLELKLNLIDKNDFKSQNWKKKDKKGVKKGKKRKFFIEFTKFYNFILRLIYRYLYFFCPNMRTLKIKENLFIDIFFTRVTTWCKKHIIFLDFTKFPTSYSD